MAEYIVKMDKPHGLVGHAVTLVYDYRGMWLPSTSQPMIFTDEQEAQDMANDWRQTGMNAYVVPQHSA